MSNFTYTTDKTGRMTIFHYGKPIKILKGTTALKLEDRLHLANTEEQQRLMAAATGNYKRGNERD
jgi:hypothetical protein